MSEKRDEIGPAEQTDKRVGPIGNNTERLVFLVCLILVGLAFSIVLEPPALWLLLAALVALSCAGTDNIIHQHGRVHLRRKRYIVTLWMLPSLVVVAALLFLRLPVFSSGLAVVAGLAVTGFLLALVIVAQYHTIDPEDQLFQTARLILNSVSYLTAFALFAAIYGSRVRSMFTATAITLIGVMVALELLRGVEARAGRNWLYAGVIGLTLGEITWALNYWTIPPLAGGVFLLLCFYTITGMVQNFLTGGLNRRIVLEYSAVAFAGLLLVLVSMMAREWL